MKKAKVFLRILSGLFALTGVVFAGYAAYALVTAESRMLFPETPAPQITASADPEVIAAGRYLAYGPAHCVQCHGTSDRAHPEKNKEEVPLSGGLEFAMGPIATRYASNLTPDRETGIGALTDAQVARAIRSGVVHTDEISFFMRFAVGNFSDEELTALVSFLRSQEPVKKAIPRGSWGLLGKLMAPMMNIAPDSVQGIPFVPPADEPSIERGEHLAKNIMLCTGCHSQMNMQTFEITGPLGGGSLPDRSHSKGEENMEYVAPNLTSDPSGITGQLSEDQFVVRIRQGRVHASSIMPWESFGRVTDADLKSIYRYLRTLPKVHNNLGPSYREAGWQPN